MKYLYKKNFHKMVSFQKVENHYRVKLNYVLLSLGPENRKILQEILNGIHGVQANTYIENSAVYKKNCILTIEFMDKLSAKTLIQMLYPVILHLRSKEDSDRPFFLHTNKKPIFYNQIADTFRVHLDYVKIGLGSENREILQTVINDHIEKNKDFFIPYSSLMKNNCIYTLDFNNESVALDLLHTLSLTISRLHDNRVYFEQWIHRFRETISSTEDNSQTMTL